MTSPEASKAIVVISRVLWFLDNRRRAVALLFPDATEDYKHEWYAREPFAFWCHLDDDNRRKVLTAALAELDLRS